MSRCRASAAHLGVLDGRLALPALLGALVSPAGLYSFLANKRMPDGLLMALSSRRACLAPAQHPLGQPCLG